MLKIFKKNQAGSVMMISILIAGAILAGTAAFASIAISQLRQARLLTSSAQAYYAAESGAEEALYALRVAKADPATSGSFGSGISWDLTTTQDDRVTIEALDQHEAASVSFLGLGSLSNGFGRFYVDWAEGSATVEATLTEIAADLTGQQVYKSLLTGSEGTISDTGQILRIRPLSPSGGVTDVTVAGCATGATCNLDNEQNFLPIPGRAVLDVTGSFRGANQAVQVKLETGSVLSGLFDYVLFSDEAISKAP